MLAIREHLILKRQEGTAGVHQIDARKVILQGHFLRAEVLLHRHREVGATLDRGVVGDDHHLATGDPADAGDDACARRLILVHAIRGQRRQFQER